MTLSDQFNELLKKEKGALQFLLSISHNETIKYDEIIRQMHNVGYTDKYVEKLINEFKKIGIIEKEDKKIRFTEQGRRAYDCL